MPAAKETGARRSKRRRTPRRKAGSFGLEAAETGAQAPPAEVEALAGEVEADGGRVVRRYREPYGGRWLLLCSLPIDRVAATPYQRDLSDTHVARLATAIEKIGSFLDPIVVVRGRHDAEADGVAGRRAAAEGSGIRAPVRYFTPNGHHRLGAMRKLGARSIIALLVPDPQLEYQILALNTEKAHNLREKASEVLRMARGLAALAAGTEADGSAGRRAKAEGFGVQTEAAYAFQFEEPPLLVLGLCYEQRPRFSGSAYHPILRRTCSEFLDLPLSQAIVLREAQARELLELDGRVAILVQQLRDRGLDSPYLKVFVVARLNPLRFARAATADFAETLAKMRSSAEKFDAARIKREDIARAPPVGEPEV